MLKRQIGAVRVHNFLYFTARYITRYCAEIPDLETTITVLSTITHGSKVEP